MTNVTDQEILDCKPTLEWHVSRFANRTPSHIEKDDIRGAAYIGLMEAAEKFDPSQGVKFRSFAGHRVKGAILDYLRSLDWVPRETRRRTFELDRAFKVAAQTLMREPSAEEVAGAAGMGLETYHETRNLQSCNASLDGVVGEDLSMADVVADEKAENPGRTAERREFFAAALERLNQSERTVIERSLAGWTLTEAGAAIGVTEGRACQLRKSAIGKMQRAAA